MEGINYTKEEKNFMEEKSLEIINKENNLNLSKEEVQIKFNRLEGISNKIFDVNIILKNGEIFHLFFKLFGKISGN